jgi:hypothetical protein
LEVYAILDRPEAVAVRFFVFKRETNEIEWWLFCFPVHGEESHAIAAMKLQSEGGICVLRDNLETIGHVLLLSKRLARLTAHNLSNFQIECR